MRVNQLICLVGVLLGSTAAVPQGLHKRAPENAATSNAAIQRIVQTAERQNAFAGVYGKVADVPGAAPKRQALTTDNQKVPGTKRVKIRSGPYTIPSMNNVRWTGKRGVITNQPDKEIEKPCDGDCVILKQWAGLEYPNGTDANINTGVWLHHMVHFVAGPTRWDPTCYGKISLPHIILLTLPSQAERLFSSGNERTVFDYNPGVNGVANSGFQVDKDDTFYYIVDLMNMNMDDRTVYIAMYYDFMDGKLPDGWSNIKTVWLDANQCGTSDVDPPQQTGAFTIASSPWKPNFEGKIISTIGNEDYLYLPTIQHVHDGGLEMSITAGEKTICQTETRYAEKPQFIFTGTMMEADERPARDHISSMTPCRNEQVKELKTDQLVSVSGLYDYDKQPGNIERGEQSEIMAIALVLVAVPPGQVTPPGWFGK